MRDASPDCIAYVNANPFADRADLVTLKLGDGTVCRWTNYKSNLTVQNWNRRATESTQTFLAPPSAPIVGIGTESEDEGLSPCSLDVTLSGEGVTLGGVSLMVAAADGRLDGAYITIDHLIMPTPGDVSLQSFTDFDGEVGEPDIGVSTVRLPCVSWLASAQAKLIPPRQYTAECPWTLYGTECGLTKTPSTGTVTAASSASTFTATTAAHNGETYTGSWSFSGWSIATETRGWWNLGTITWDGNVTAALAGERSDVLSNGADGVFVLATPASAAPQIGDTFSIVSGCNKDSSSCNRYSNLVRFGGFKFVPPNATTPVR